MGLDITMKIVKEGFSQKGGGTVDVTVSPK